MYVKKKYLIEYQKEDLKNLKNFLLSKHRVFERLMCEVEFWGKIKPDADVSNLYQSPSIKGSHSTALTYRRRPTKEGSTVAQRKRNEEIHTTKNSLTMGKDTNWFGRILTEKLETASRQGMLSNATWLHIATRVKVVYTR